MLINLETLATTFSLIPIEPNGKRPTVKEWQKYNNLKEIQTHHYLNAGNYGAVVGHNLIIDVDPRNGGAESYLQLLFDFPQLFKLKKTVLTPSGGFHIYTSLPEYTTQGLRKNLRQYPGIDFLSGNMYVVAPGSTLDGNKWATAPEAVWPIPEVDYSLLDALTRPTVQESTTPARADVITPAQLTELLSQLDPGNYREHEQWLYLMAACSYVCPTGSHEYASWSAQDPQYSDQYSNTQYRYETFTPSHTNPITGRTLLRELPQKPDWFMSAMGLGQKKVEFAALQQSHTEQPANYDADMHHGVKDLNNGPQRQYLKDLWAKIAVDSTLDPMDRGVYRGEIARTLKIPVKVLEEQVALPKLGRTGQQPIDPEEDSSQLMRKAMTLAIAGEPGGLLHVAGAFYRYDPTKGHWTFISQLQIESLCQKIMLGPMMQEYTDAGIMVSGNHVAATARMMRNHLTAESVDDPFNTTNGIGQIAINTPQGRLTLSEDNPEQGWMIEPHHPHQYQRTVCGVKFNPTPGATPVFDQFLDQATAGDESDKLKRQILTLIGYAAASNAPRRRKCFFLHGDTATGKSVILDLITDILGRDNTSAISLGDFGRQFSLQPLVNGVLANLSGEMSGKHASARVFKELVSGDAIEVSIKFNPTVKFENHATLIFAGNSLPRMQDDSAATRDRMCVLPLRNMVLYQERDPRLSHKLKNEMDDIFSKALLQFQQEMIKDNLTEVFDNGSVGGLTLNDWYSESDPIRNWSEEMLLDEEEHVASFVSLYQSYSEWCKAAGVVNPRTRAVFSRVLSAQMGKKVAMLPGGRGIKGIRLQRFEDASWMS